MPVGPWELAIILVIVVIIFGVGKLPQIGGALGQGIREFRQSAQGPEGEEETTSASSDKERKNVDTKTVVTESEEG